MSNDVTPPEEEKDMSNVLTVVAPNGISEKGLASIKKQYPGREIRVVKELPKEMQKLENVPLRTPPTPLQAAQSIIPKDEFTERPYGIDLRSRTSKKNKGRNKYW